MHKLISLLIVFSFPLIPWNVSDASETIWVRRLEDAKKAAKLENKDLFILFTGHGWCYSCELLDREVFQKQEFVKATSKNYVFVELDFNFGETPEEQKRKARFIQLQEHYLTPAVPTAVLADCAGKPYSIITGYSAKSGLKGYLKRVTTARKVKAKYNTLLTAANSKSGKARAKTLSDALDCIALELGTIEERGDDPLLHFYKNSVQEILDLTDNAGSIADKYIALDNKRAEWIANNSMLARLSEFTSTKDYTGAIKYIDECLKTKTKHDSVYWRLQESRQTYLEWSDQYEKALANCRQLIAMDDIPADSRESLLDGEAYNLFRLNRIDEGLAHFDRRIRLAADDEKRLQLLGSKVQMALRRAPVDKSIEACEMYRNATKPGTDDWFNATFFLALELRRAERHLQALNVINEFLEKNRTSHQLLDAAESYIALKRYKEAASVIKEAYSKNQKLKDSPRRGEVEEYHRMIVRIKKLKQRIPDSFLKGEPDEQ